MSNTVFAALQTPYAELKQKILDSDLSRSEKIFETTYLGACIDTLELYEDENFSINIDQDGRVFTSYPLQ